MLKNSTEMFQKAAEIVASQARKSWKEANVEAEIDDQLADLCVWYVDENGNEETLDEVPGDLIHCFVDLRRNTGDEEKGLWSKCLFTIGSDGDFKADFSYEPPRWAS